MKLPELQGIDTKGSPDLETLKVTISNKNQGRMLRYTTRDMYQDKIGSMVREIVSNAWDANRRAKSTKPVMVKITENQFQVRDFGASMSEEMVKEIYLNVGESDKRDGNDEIGGFGLGSKTPLAYSDNFTLSTIHNDEKIIWVLSLTTEEIKVGLKWRGPANGEVGTEVTVNVRPGDKSQIDEAIKKQLLYFNNLFVEGVENWDNGYELVVGKNFIANKDYPPRRMQLCLGQVAYPFPNDYIHEYCNSRNVTDAFFDYPIGLSLQIGQLPVIPSREVIEYNDDSKDVIYKALDSLRDEIMDIYAKDEDSETSVLQMMRRVVELGLLDIGGIKVNLSCFKFAIKQKTNKNFPDWSYKYKEALQKVYVLRSLQNTEHKQIIAENGEIKGRQLDWQSRLSNDQLLTYNLDNWTKVFGTDRCMILKAGESYNKRTAGYHVSVTGKRHFYFQEKAEASWMEINPKWDSSKTDAENGDEEKFIKKMVPQKYVDQLHAEIRAKSTEFSSIEPDEDYRLTKRPSGRIKLNVFARTNHCSQWFMDDFLEKNNSWGTAENLWILMPFSQRELAENIAGCFGLRVCLVKADALEESLRDPRFMSLNEFMRSRHFRLPATCAKIQMKVRAGGYKIIDEDGDVAHALGELYYLAHLLNPIQYESWNKYNDQPGSSVITEDCKKIIQYIEDVAPNFFDQSILNTIDHMCNLSQNSDLRQLLDIKDIKFQRRAMIKFKIKGILSWLTK